MSLELFRLSRIGHDRTNHRRYAASAQKIRERTVAQCTDFALRCATLHMQYVTLIEITTRNIRPDLFHMMY